MLNSLPNEFDQLTAGFDTEGAMRQAAEHKAKCERRDYLIHQVFKQSEVGQDLLAMWVENGLIMAPTARKGDDLLAVGLEEGKKEFIRNILITINKVEGNINE